MKLDSAVPARQHCTCAWGHVAVKISRPVGMDAPSNASDATDVTTMKR